MRLAILSFSLVFACLPALSFAFFCPSNFNQIQMGDSIDTVLAQCGKPDKQSQTKKTIKEEHSPQEWNYYLPQANSIGSITPGGQQSLQVIFDANGKVINISFNNNSVGSTSICGHTISLGDTRENVKNACGKAAYINKQQGDESENNTSPPTTLIEELTYAANPRATLVFENGKLVSQK